MTSFNEGDINRAADGKFAAKSTSVSDVDLNDDPRDLPVGERFAELDDSELVDSAEFGDEFVGDVSDATIKRDENGALVAMMSVTDTVGPYDDATLTHDMVQRWADSDSDSRGATVEAGYINGAFQVTRNMTARLDESKPIDQIHDALDGEGFGVYHSADDYLTQWADDNDAWPSEGETASVRRFDHDDMEGADLGEITDGKPKRLSIVDVGDVDVSWGRYEDTGNEYVDASTTRALHIETDADEKDVLGAMQQGFDADSVTARGDGVYDVKFSTRMDHPFPSVDDAHYGLTHHDGLNEVNHMIETGSASKEMPRLVKNYRDNLDRSSTRATDAWNRVAPGRQFPHETFRAEFNDSDPTVFYESADKWAEGYAGITSASGENNIDLIFRSYGAEAAARDAAKEA